MLEIGRAHLHYMRSHLSPIWIEGGEKDIERAVAILHGAVFHRPVRIGQNRILETAPIDEGLLLRHCRPSKRNRQHQSHNNFPTLHSSSALVSPTSEIAISIRRAKERCLWTKMSKTCLKRKCRCPYLCLFY